MTDYKQMKLNLYDIIRFLEGKHRLQRIEQHHVAPDAAGFTWEHPVHVCICGWRGTRSVGFNEHIQYIQQAKEAGRRLLQIELELR